VRGGLDRRKRGGLSPEEQNWSHSKYEKKKDFRLINSLRKEQFRRYGKIGKNVRESKGLLHRREEVANRRLFYFLADGPESLRGRRGETERVFFGKEGTIDPLATWRGVCTFKKKKANAEEGEKRQKKKRVLL